MKEWEKTDLIEFLKANIEVFAWTTDEMPGIDPSFIKHELNVMSEACLVNIGEEGPQLSMWTW